MRLADSRIFRGDDPTLEPAKRPVWTEQRRIIVYILAAYRDGTSSPVAHHSRWTGAAPLVRNALDNLTLSKDPKRRLPAFTVPSRVEKRRQRQQEQRARTGEYDTMSDRLARFINDEVLPRS